MIKYPALCEEWDPDNELGPESYTAHNGTKVGWICKKNQKYQATICNLTNSNPSGCDTCLYCPSCGLFRTRGILFVFCKPKNENKLYQKTKEFAVVKYLKEGLPNNDFIHNKSVGKAWIDGHLFPDILYNCDNYNVIVEVDENKHRASSYKCEEQRMYDIIAKLNLPTIFIRYNPDSKNSALEMLVKTLIEQFNHGKYTWNDFGFKVIYLFY